MHPKLARRADRPQVHIFIPSGDGAALHGDDLRAGPRLALDVVSFGNLRIGDTFAWSVYGEAPIAGGLAATAELFGRLSPSGDDRLDAPIEAIAGARLATSRVHVLAGAGAGFGRAYGTPDWRVCLGVQLRFGR